MKLYLSNFNILHLENCPYWNNKALIKFRKKNNQSNSNFLFSTTKYLVSIEKNSLIEICPYCLGKKFNLLSPEFNLFKK